MSRYQELKDSISSRLNHTAEDFFVIGYSLRQISEEALFLGDGYKSIWEFAKGEYNLGVSSASRFMAINARFSDDGGVHMAERYIGMGVSKLQEMLGLPDEELEKVTQETTVREIRAMKKKQEESLSFFGFPKTVRSKGSLITTPGCGDGKYDCFLCSRECNIRQEPRRCRLASSADPKACVRISNERWKANMQFSLYRHECQLLHLDLAPVRSGDSEPSPCCNMCKYKMCSGRCDVAKKMDEEEQKKEDAEKHKRQLEIKKDVEAKKLEPNWSDIKALYDWLRIKVADNIDWHDLKTKYRNAGGGGSGFDYQGSARGVRINYKKEITWAQTAKRLQEIQEQERLKEKQEGSVQVKRKSKTVREKKADIIEADFKEIDDESVKQTEPDVCEVIEIEQAEVILERGIAEISGSDQEYYEMEDVADLLEHYSKDLEEYREAEMPGNVLQKQRILVDALNFYLGGISEVMN